MKVAVVQTNAGSNKKQNVRRAVDLVSRAVSQGAEFIALPEAFNYRGPLSKENLSAVAERIPGESILPFMEISKKSNVSILAGSIFEKIPNKQKCYNTSVLINQGKVSARYRKINLFDAVLDKAVIKESTWFMPGHGIQVGAVKEFKVGLSVCYDLRFGDLFRKYAQKGVHVLCVPSVFTRKTGQAHWEVLVRARAIESLSYVLAPNQTGEDYRGVAAYGNSLIVTPWGEVLARAFDKEEIIYADISRTAIDEARSILPDFAKKMVGKKA
jgi:deaminated glutathione amidase